jgi:membrane-associated protease RseP (regulator of RpoE activity)
MPDETPVDPISEDATASDATTESTPATTPPPAAPAATATSERKGVFVPRWLAVVLGLVLAVALVGGGGFALGRSTADDDHDGGGHHGRVEDLPGRQGGPGGGGSQVPGPPRNGGNGGNGGNGNGGGSGSSPTPTSRVFLGVVVEPAGSGDTGAKIVQVAPGSPADDAGLKSGDVITKVDDADITDAAALAKAIQSHSSGDEVTITYDRDGTSATAKVSLAERTQSGPPRTAPPA